MDSLLKLKDIYNALYDFEKQYAEINKITINEAIILYALNDGKPKVANKLYDYVGLSKSRVSRVLTDIEKKGYIVREAGTKDKRNVLFSLTSEGVEKSKEITKQRINFSKLIEQIVKLGE